MPKNDENTAMYSTGARALEFKADGSGFIFYSSGRVAVCKGVVDGHCRYYMYGDDAKSTPLGAVNEHTVGFFLGAGGIRLALNKVGGLLTDQKGYIVREWRYDLAAHMPPPAGVLAVKLNKSIVFEFRNPAEMTIKFSHEGVLRDLDAGVKPMREGNYLDNSVRLPGGKLEPQIDRVSLVSRQLSFGNAMKAKRDRLKPRSRNLAGECKALVAGLERRFDEMYPKVEPFPDPSWKSMARSATVHSLPLIRSTGLEVGPVQGLGSTIYSSVVNDYGGGGLRRSSSWVGGMSQARTGVEEGRGGSGGGGAAQQGGTPAATAKLKKDGKWLGELDIRHQIEIENPLLKRSFLLQAASGRYAEEIVVPGGIVSASNPTGKATVSGTPLRTIPAFGLDVFLREEAGPEQLVVVVCVRGDDPSCSKVQNVAEIANGFLLLQQHTGDSSDHTSERKSQRRSKQNSTNRNSSKTPTAGSSWSAGQLYQIVRVDFSQSQATADKYGVRSMPAFLMYYGGRLAWTGTLGGIPVKATPLQTIAAGRRVLLVEPCAKAQLSAERALRKGRCDWDLVQTASHALARNQAVRTDAVLSRAGEEVVEGVPAGVGYGVVMISDSLGAADVIAIEKAFHGGGGKSGRPLVVGLATTRGDAYLLPRIALDVISVGFTDGEMGRRSILPPHLAVVADAALTKPIRVSALREMFQCCAHRASEGGTGDGGGGRASGSAIRAAGAFEGDDSRYKGATPSRLLKKMEHVRSLAVLGKLVTKRAMGGGALGEGGGRLRPGKGGKAPGAEILISAQETEYKGYALEKVTLQHVLHT